MGLGQEDHFTNYRRVLNRATWCPLIASRILLGLIVLALISRDRPIVLAGDDTIERRHGRRIKAKGATVMQFGPRRRWSSSVLV